MRQLEMPVGATNCRERVLTSFVSTLDILFSMRLLEMPVGAAICRL